MLQRLPASVNLGDKHPNGGAIRMSHSTVAGRLSPRIRMHVGHRGNRATASAVAQDQAAWTTATSGLKSELVDFVSPLDRGLAASGWDAKEVEELASKLERRGGNVVLTSPPSPSSSSSSSSPLDLLAGDWGLIYSSGFNTGSLGGLRPGPPAALLPTSPGKVVQRIDPATSTLDNIVEFTLLSPQDLAASLLPRLLSPFGATRPSSSSLGGSWSGGDGDSGGDGSGGRKPSVRLTLRHSFEILGSSVIRIVYDDTSAELVVPEEEDPGMGRSSSPAAMLKRLLPSKVDLPSLPQVLRPQTAFLRSGKFEVSYLDDTLRITRGDRGELRIYLRDSSKPQTPGADQWTLPPDYDD